MKHETFFSGKSIIASLKLKGQNFQRFSALFGQNSTLCAQNILIIF